MKEVLEKVLRGGWIEVIVHDDGFAAVGFESRLFRNLEKPSVLESWRLLAENFYGGGS